MEKLTKITEWLFRLVNHSVEKITPKSHQHLQSDIEDVELGVKISKEPEPLPQVIERTPQKTQQRKSTSFIDPSAMPTSTAKKSNHYQQKTKTIRLDDHRTVDVSGYDINIDFDIDNDNHFLTVH